MYGLSSFSFNDAFIPYILNILLKFAIISSQWESLLRPYQHDLMVR